MELEKRKQIRLKTYDYSENGYYFITICTKDKEHILCKKDCILREEGNSFELSDIGNIVDWSVENIKNIYDGFNVDCYVIMPNHIHLLLSININNETSISKMIQQTKSWVSKKVGFTIWQKSFYDHVVRNEHDYYEITRYIQMNPLKWQYDRYYNHGNGMGD